QFVDLKLQWPEIDLQRQIIFEQGWRALNQCQERARKVEQLVQSSIELLHRCNFGRPTGKTPEVSAGARTQGAAQSARASHNPPPPRNHGEIDRFRRSGAPLLTFVRTAVGTF